jgi:hypothetical protein
MSFQTDNLLATLKKRIEELEKKLDDQDDRISVVEQALMELARKQPREVQRGR